MLPIRRIVSGDIKTGIVHSLVFTNDYSFLNQTNLYEDTVESVPEGFPHEKVYLEPDNTSKYSCRLVERTKINVEVDSLIKKSGKEFIFTVPDNIILYFTIKSVEFSVVNGTQLSLPVGRYYCSLNYSNPKNIPYYTDSFYLEVIE